MTVLYLVRHGQASFGADSYDVLSQNGIRQAQVLGRHWQCLGLKPDSVCSGSMARQRDTATHADYAPQILPAFNEYDFLSIVRAYLPVVQQRDPARSGDGEKPLMDNALFQRLFERAVDCWVRGEPHNTQGCETWPEFCARCEDGLISVATRDRESVAVFTSGGVIAVALRKALALSDERTFALNWRIYNGSVHRFAVGKRGLSLLGFNDVTHLELEADPSLLTFR